MVPGTHVAGVGVMKIILSPAKKMNDKEQCSSFGQSVFECTVNTTRLY